MGDYLLESKADITESGIWEVDQVIRIIWGYDEGLGSRMWRDCGGGL